MSKVAWSPGHAHGHDARYDRRAEAEALRSARLAPARSEDVDAGRDRSAAGDTAARRGNPLVAAMMKAVQGLSLAAAGTPAPAPATAPAPAASAAVGTPTPTLAPAASAAASPAEAAASTDTPAAPGSAAPAASPATTLKDAAVGFAQELFGTLSEIADRSARHHGPRGHHHAYGHLAHRLEALASRLEAAAAAAPAPAPAPTAADAEPPASPSAPVPEGLQPVDTAGTPPAADSVVAADGSTVRITIEFTLPRSAPALTPQESKLKTAFENFVRALNPGAAQASEGGGNAAPATADLANFLRSIAQALRSDGPAADSHASMAGSLVNLTA